MTVMVVGGGGGGAPAASRYPENAVFSCISTAAFWGTPDWCGEASEAARDSRYSTRNYQTISAWETARDADLTSSGNTEVAEIRGDDWAGDTDTTQFTLDGWTTNATNYIWVTAVNTGSNENDSRASFTSLATPLYNTNYYALAPTAGTGLFMNNTGRIDVIIEGIQIFQADTASNKFCMSLADAGSGSTLVIRKSWLEYNDPAAAAGMIFSETNLTTTIQNSILVNATASSVVLDVNAGNVKVYNSLITGQNQDGGTYAGIDNDSGTAVTVVNSIIFAGGSTDIEGSATYQESGSNEGTNACDDTCGDVNVPALDISPGVEATNWGVVFTDYANDDFTITSNSASPCDGTGNCQTFMVASYTNGDNSLVPTDDIKGNARPTTAGATISIGPFEY
jgi:hypothetical protein